eukprot:jgi/Psemu1/2453/gm1.2453_g
MGDTDFRELMVARPPTLDEANQSMYKRIFVKGSPQSKTLHSDDLWDRIQRQSQMYRDGTKFVFRQFLRENVAQTRNFMRVQNTLRGMKDEQSSLKQELNKQKEIAESYKKELLVAREKIGEKDRQLAHFRKLFESRTPQSPSSIVSSGSRGRRNHSNTERGTLPGRPDGGGMAARASARTSTRPRRVSDQCGGASNRDGGMIALAENVPPTFTGHERYQEAGPSHRSSQPLQSRSPAPRNPYEQQLDGTGTRIANRGNIMPPPPISPYKQPSSARPLSQENHNRPMPNKTDFAMHNPYQKTTGPSAPYRSHSLPDTNRQPHAMSANYQQRSGTQHYGGSSGGSVSSRRSTGSGSSGGRIRHITAATGEGESDHSLRATPLRATEVQVPTLVRNSNAQIHIRIHIHIHIQIHHLGDQRTTTHRDTISNDHIREEDPIGVDEDIGCRSKMMSPSLTYAGSGFGDTKTFVLIVSKIRRRHQER